MGLFSNSWSPTPHGPPPWAADIHSPRPNRIELTLLDAWTQSKAIGDLVKRVMAPTIAIGGWVRDSDLWPDAIYSTAHLTEWRRDTGLKYSRRPQPRWRRVLRRPLKELQPLRIDVERPTRDEFEIAGDNVAFTGRTDTAVSDSPDWSVSTWQVLEATPAQPVTMSELRRRFAEPLLALTSFVADRPEALTQEILIDKEERRRVEVWRAGAVVTPRRWRSAGRGYLFDAAELVDFPAAINRWWEMHGSTWPALGVFADSIGDGLTYTPARLITVFSALERYGKARHSSKDLKQLRTYSGVDSAVTGATNSRNPRAGSFAGVLGSPRRARPSAGPEDPARSLHL